ncbi:MAG: glycosyltransferase family 4 protein [Armatimonadota bacterium]
MKNELAKLNVALQCHSFLACNLELANQLCDSHSVLLSTIQLELLPFGDDFNRQLDSRIDCRIWDNIRLRSASYYLQRYRLLSVTKNCDLIHCQYSTDPVMNLVMMMWIRRNHQPSILTVHDPQPHSGEDRTYSRQPLRRLIAQRLVTNHPNLLSYSEYSKQKMHEYYPNAGRHYSAAVWHGPMDFLTRYPDLPVPGDAPVVLFAGRLSKYKGADVMLRAWKQVSQTHPTAKLLMVGAGVESASIQQQIDEMPSVQFVNRYVSHHEMAECFSRSHLVVMPYLDATQSGIQATAIAFEKPVVASRVGAIPEMLDEGESGLLVSPGDADALAAAVSTCLSDGDLLQHLQEGAARLHRGRLAWPLLSRQIEGHYRALLQRGS